MRAAHDDFLTLRLPAALRAELDGQARRSGSRLSVVTRNALAVGLASIRTGAEARTAPAGDLASATR